MPPHAQLRMMFASGQPLEAKAAVETLQRSLRAVAADQEKVIHDVCDGNAMDIAQCVAELEYMHSSRDDVVQAIAKGNDALQVGRGRGEPWKGARWGGGGGAGAWQGGPAGSFECMHHL